MYHLQVQSKIITVKHICLSFVFAVSSHANTSIFECKDPVNVLIQQAELNGKCDTHALDCGTFPIASVYIINEYALNDNYFLRL